MATKQNPTDNRVAEQQNDEAARDITRASRKGVVNKNPLITDFSEQMLRLVAGEEWQKVSFSDKRGGAPVDHPEAQVGLPRLIRFGDDGHNLDAVAVLDIRVFIQGVDVSSSIRAGSTECEQVGLSGHNTFNFVLDNSEDAFVWTEKNLLPIYGHTHPAYRAAAKLKKAPELKAIFTANEKAKQQVYDYKADPARNPITTNARGTSLFAKYDLIPNKTIFQRNDPVRAFILYPYRVPGGVQELWMPLFTGYVEYCSGDDDALTGNQAVTVQCADFRHCILERQRLSVDNTLGLLNPVDDLGFRNARYDAAGSDQFGVRKNSKHFDPKSVAFYDQLKPDLFGQPFSKQPLEVAVKDLLVYVASPTNDNEGRSGVTNVEFGGSFYLNAKTRAERRAFLEKYHKFTLFGPKGRPWTVEEVNEVGRGTTSDGAYAPHNFRLWFLLPPGGTGASNLNDLSTISAPAAHNVNWTNRLDVLRKLVGTLDYEVFQSATGDMHVEFSFADFRPEDFGTFKESFRVRKDLKSTSYGDEQSPDPIGALTFVTGYGEGIPSKDGSVAGLDQTVVVYAPYTIARYGVTEETVTAPHLAVSDKKTAQARALIEFQKRNADCNTLSFAAVWRPFMLPNRPVHHLPRTRMGNTVSVSTSITVGDTPSASLGLAFRHVRTFTGHYRSPEDLKLDDVQKEEFRVAAIEPDTQLETIRAGDDFEAMDPIELQVYTNVMGGDFLPSTARMGWGSDGAVAPASGVYILNPTSGKSETAPPAVEPAITSHEPTTNAESLPLVTEEEEEEEPSTYKFASDPLSTMTLTSPFGGRTDPVTGVKNSTHGGTDYGAPLGTSLHAVGDGRVLKAGQETRKKYLGNGILISYQTNDGKYKVSCLHLDSVAVNPGDKIKAGQVIGRIGNTGKSTGPHLHISVKDLSTNKEVDPSPLFPGSVREVG